jgi:energy-coupling factor transporter transmembrane protein EcfT
MAELTTFSFFPGTSLVHQMDARFKIIGLILLSLMSLNVYFWGLGILTLLLVIVLRHIRLPLKSGLKELRYFIILIFFVFVARTLTAGGPPLFDLKFITISAQGLCQGTFVCWRLALIVLLGLAFISTTRPAEIKAAIQWFLKPIPIISEQKVATMLSLIMRFVPVIFDQIRETSEAQKARGVENRKNPLYRLVKIGIVLIRRTFENADNLAIAMEARCYTENRTDPELVGRARDWLAMIAIGLLCIALLFLSK